MTSLGNVFILGDSYSTFEGYNPKGYDVWYSPVDNGMTDVRSVEECWWHLLLSECKAMLIRNSSYSGTTVCHTGYGGSDCRNNSFVARLDKLIADGFFEKNRIDTFIIFGSTNDCWAGSPTGEEKLSNWQEEDLFKVYPAFSYMLSRAALAAPDARKLFIMNYGLNPDFTEKFRKSCRVFGVEFLPLTEFSVNEGHPTVLGMKQIKEQVLRYLENN